AGAIMVCWDITQQRKLEARLAVADRMATVGQLAAGVAHEINNPLTYLLGSLDLLEQRLAARDGLDAAGRSTLAAAVEGGGRLRPLVRALARPPQRGAPTRTAVDVHAVLDAALRMAHGELRCRARVVRSFGELPRIWVNDARLTQVFLNLVVNAAQAIPEG